MTSILKILIDFQKISGLAVNLSKTAVCNIGVNTQNTLFAQNLGIKIENSFLLLGVKFTNNTLTCDENFKHIKQVISDSIEFWGRRIYSVIGRSFALKCFILSLITHRALVLPNPDENWISALQQDLIHFAFNKKTVSIATTQVVLPIKCGGFGIIDVKNFWEGLKVKLLLKTRYSSDIYATMFNDELASHGYDSLDDLTAAGPQEITQVANAVQNPFWKQALHYWRRIVIGHYSTNKTNLENSPIVGNPLFAIMVAKTFLKGHHTHYGKKLIPLYLEQPTGLEPLAAAKLSDILFTHPDEYYDKIAQLSNGKISWLVARKMYRFLTATQSLHESLREENALSDKRCIFKLLEKNKPLCLFRKKH